jgi:hypothetical protein
MVAVDAQRVILLGAGRTMRTTNRYLRIGVFVIVTTLLAWIAIAGASTVNEENKHPVTFIGGHETDRRDHGRPVVLIAAALGVTPDVFREAFSKVAPAYRHATIGDDARRKKETLMKVLGPHNVTNERLDKISNYYRDWPDDGEHWRTRPAKAYAIVDEGKIKEIVVTEPGSGYSSMPTATVKGYEKTQLVTRVNFDTDLRKNGQVTSVELMPEPIDIVGSIYGKSITAADIGFDIPIDPALQFNGGDRERWELMRRISDKFGKPVHDRFVKDQKIEATADEIAGFKKFSRQSDERRFRETSAELAVVKTALGSPDLTDSKRAELTKKHDRLERRVSHSRDSLKRGAPDEIAKHFILTWKIERELHRKYGGRIIFQQFGAEALDARRMLYEAAEKNGDLKFDNPDVRHMFYYYYTHVHHTTIDDVSLFERATFWGDPAMKKPE